MQVNHREPYVWAEEELYTKYVSSINTTLSSIHEVLPSSYTARRSHKKIIDLGFIADSLSAVAMKSRCRCWEAGVEFPIKYMLHDARLRCISYQDFVILHSKRIEYRSERYTPFSGSSRAMEIVCQIPENDRRCAPSPCAVLWKSIAVLWQFYVSSMKISVDWRQEFVVWW